MQARFLSLTIAGVFLGGAGLHDVLPWLRILFLILILRAGLIFGSEVSAHQSAAGIKTDLRQQLFSRLAVSGPAFAHREQTGELVTTLVAGVESLEAYFSQYLTQLILALLVPLAILVVLFPIDPLTGIVLLLTAPLIPIFMVLIAGQAETATHRRWKTLTRLSAYFLDTLQGLETLKLLGQSQTRAERIARTSEQYRRATMGVLRITFLSALTLELVGTISMAIVAVEVGLRLLYGGMLYPEALFILVLAPEFYLPLRTLGLRFHAAMPAVSATTRIVELLSGPATDEGRLAGNLPPVGQGLEPVAPAVPIQASGFQKLVFDRVSYAYPEGETDLRPALQEVSFEIQAGDRVALVGPSGSGKSTIMALLLRFIEPTGGQIQVDGQPLQTIDPVDWRRLVGWVPQQTYVFNDTLEANLRLASPAASSEELQAALRMAHLDEVIRILPAGLQTRVGERGTALSGGQVQRLALARAFLKNAPFLLLDEPSAHLDPEQEGYFQAALDQLGSGKTILSIAHRLPTARNADRILVMAGGRVVECGRHADLFELKGLYYRMVNAYVAG